MNSVILISCAIDANLKLFYLKISCRYNAMRKDKNTNAGISEVSCCMKRRVPF